MHRGSNPACTAPVDTVLDLVGSTPMLRLRRYAPHHEVFAKLEYLNPGGSIKDRAALGMLRAAEARGDLIPGRSTVIEATAGNTGLGLALACGQLGYRCVIVMTHKYSREKMMLVRALGAELVVLPVEAGMEGAVAHAAALAQSLPHAYLTRQYDNPDNPSVHAATTAAEIWQQCDGRVDAVVLGAGSGGTFTGVVRALKEHNPNLHAVCVEPEGSVFSGDVPGTWSVEGIGSTYLPGVLDLALADRILQVPDAISHTAMRELIRQEGCLVGPSSGTNAWAAREVASTLPAGSRVITLFPDGTERYASKFPAADLEF